MELLVERVNVWATPIQDEPGGLAKVLAGLRDAGANLDFAIARRCADKPGEGVLFVTPIRGDREVQAASDLGFNVTNSVHSLRIEGDNAPGVGAMITEKVAQAGINLHGFSAAVIGARFIAYIGFDSKTDAEKARGVLASL
jgi:hypothetical protein